MLNIKAALRIRPCTEQDEPFVSKYLQQDLTTSLPTLLFSEKHCFQFDKIFWQHASQEEVFEDIAKPLCESVLAGYNASIFAYGQTGKQEGSSRLTSRNVFRSVS
jgi:hypothetical protein